MKIEIDVKIPEGYEATGEYRRPKKGEKILIADGSVDTADFDYECAPLIILRKIEPKQPKFQEICVHGYPLGGCCQNAKKVGDPYCHECYRYSSKCVCAENKQLRESCEQLCGAAKSLDESVSELQEQVTKLLAENACLKEELAIFETSVEELCRRATFVCLDCGKDFGDDIFGANEHECKETE